MAKPYVKVWQTALEDQKERMVLSYLLSMVENQMSVDEVEHFYLNSKNSSYPDEFKISIIKFKISLVLILAFVIEHKMGHQPCKLCIYERIPYFVSIF